MLYKDTASDLVFPASHMNCCRMCGATSYRPVVARDANGAMRPTDLYRCSGCSVVFTDPGAWRNGGQDAVPCAPPPPKPVSGAAAATPPFTPSAPNFATYGVTAPVSPREDPV
jgi:hypothetical protein